MKRKQGHILTAVLVDYDNIYLALRRKSEEAARRFAKDAGLWLKEIETGLLITPTNSLFGDSPRRIVLNRCYGNPVPRRNTHDNSTDMYSFPFVRHHFLRSGFEVVDCPPLTAQLKNSSDIRMVMDVRDYLLHDTYFDEFIILSGDADFTPVLHRLRAHARRTAIFANDHTAVPYKSISDGEIREADLIAQLLEGGRASTQAPAVTAAPAAQIEDLRRAIIDEAMAAVSASSHPIPLELLVDRVVRALGHENTAGTGWAGAGTFRDLLSRSLPQGIRISDQPPYLVIDQRRQLAEPRRAELAPAPFPLTSQPAHLQTQPVAGQALQQMPLSDQAVSRRNEPAYREPSQQQFAPPAPASPPQPQPAAAAAAAFSDMYRSPLPPLAATAEQMVARPQPQAEPMPAPPVPTYVAAPLPSGYHPFGPQAPQRLPQGEPRPQQSMAGPAYIPPAASPLQPPAAVQQVSAEVATASALQQSIARIHEACQAPPLSPPEYRVLFDAMAREITERGLAGSQTLTNIVQRAQELGVDVRRDDIRFVLEVVSESDPWFEQGASASLFAGRFRNFVVARCRSQGLNLSVDELDLIEAWFVAGAPAVPTSAPSQTAPNSQVGHAAASGGAGQGHGGAAVDYRSQEQAARPAPPSYGQAYAPAFANSGAPPTGATGNADEEFPRIVRTRLRG